MSQERISTFGRFIGAPRIGDIEAAVCLRFSLQPERLKSCDRHRKVAWPRQIAMYLTRELTGASLPMIGRHFGRDHTTVLHACRAVTRRLSDPSFHAKVQDIIGAVPTCREGGHRLTLPEPEFVYSDPLAKALARAQRLGAT